MKIFLLFLCSCFFAPIVTTACHVEIKGDTCWAAGVNDTLRVRLFELGDWDDNVTYNWESSTDGVTWQSLNVHTKRYVVTTIANAYMYYRVSAKENTPGLQAYCNDYFCNQPYISSPFRVWNCTVLASVTWSNTSVRIDGNTAHISWKFTGDETVSTFRVERSINARNFSLVTPSLAALSEEYEVYDDVTGLQDVYYRIVAVMTSGQTFTSDVLHASRTKTWTVSVYPNPFVEWFIVKDLPPTATVFLYDGKGQQVVYDRDGNRITLLKAKPAVYTLKIIDNKNLFLTARVLKL